MPISEFDPQYINIVSDIKDWSGSLDELREKDHFDFIPYFGWKGHIELPNYQNENDL